MEFLKATSKYVIIIFVWIALAFCVAYFQYNSNNLSASVLSLVEQDYFEAKTRDAWYKKENQIFELFLSEKVKDAGNLEISLLFAPENFERNIDNLTTSYTINSIKEISWNLVLNIEWYENWDLSEWIFQIPFSGDSKDVTLEYVRSADNNFSVWSLDNIENQTH